MLTDTLFTKFICFHLFNISNKLNSTLKIELVKPSKSEMFELKSYEKFRDTEDVRFFDISINNSNFRDLAMLMVEACRSVGIPSRFVSGYHFEDPLPNELDLHAWAELYIPGAGWRGFDPSGKGLIDERYLTLVSSSKSNLTAVITGNFRGRTNLKNNLSWEIKPLQINN